jgi:hypothetical protein
MVKLYDQRGIEEKLGEKREANGLNEEVGFTVSDGWDVEIGRAHGWWTASAATK